MLHDLKILQSIMFEKCKNHIPLGKLEPSASGKPHGKDTCYLRFSKHSLPLNTTYYVTALTLWKIHSENQRSSPILI